MEVPEFCDFRVMSRPKALNISVFSIFPGKLHFPFRSDAPEVTLSGFAGGETWPLPDLFLWWNRVDGLRGSHLLIRFAQVGRSPCNRGHGLHFRPGTWVTLQAVEHRLSVGVPQGLHRKDPPTEWSQTRPGYGSGQSV